MQVKTKFNQFYIDKSRVDGFHCKTQALESDGVLCLIQEVVDDGEIHRNFITIASDKIIPLAEAIIKHFKEDWNAYEENISDRYRAPTEEEMAKFLAENPNYKPIPKEVCDPDAPLTSELAQNFVEE